MKIDPRIPEPVQPIIKEYLRLTEQRLGGLLHAAYVVGSIALGEFNEHFSDIDFVTAISRKVTSIELGHLRTIHQFIEKRHPKWKMSGSNIQASALGKLGNDLRPHPQLHDGKRRQTVHNTINSVTWSELRICGISLIGAAPENLSFTVNWDGLIAEMGDNLNTYWSSWTRQPRRVAVLYSSWGIQWAILEVLRSYFTFQKNTITTKVKAGEYALGSLPQRWHPLIQEVISIRQTKQDTAYRSRFGRMFETVAFLQYVIDVCNRDLVL